MRIGKQISHWAVPVLLVTTLAACGEKKGEEAQVSTSEAPGAAAPATTPPAEGAAAAPAAGAVAANAPAGVTPAMIQEGHQIFTSNGNCYTCHGANAEGTALAPSLTDNQVIWIHPGPNEYEEIVKLVKAGVPQPKEHPAPMPPMGGATLTDDQVNAVSAYVWSLTNKG